MKIITDSVKKNGKRRITVELDPSEKLIAICPDSFYKLGYPFQETVQSHIIEDAEQVTWCPLGQEWVS